MDNERIAPFVFTVNETGERYELDFNRESVKFAERKGFSIEKCIQQPTTYIPELWFCAFRKNHNTVGRNTTDKILLEEFKGLTPEYFERLIGLFNQAGLATVVRDDEDEEVETKNSKVTVEL